jgi:hypothetical protein
VTHKRARPWIVAAWVTLSLVTAAKLGVDESWRLGEPPDCSASILEELRVLDRRLPPRVGLTFVGAAESLDCRADWLARNALAPRLILTEQTEQLVTEMYEHGFDVDVRRPRIVIAYGDEGEAWLRGHAEVVRLYRSSPRVVVAWRR